MRSTESLSRVRAKVRCQLEIDFGRHAARQVFESVKVHSMHFRGKHSDRGSMIVSKESSLAHSVLKLESWHKRWVDTKPEPIDFLLSCETVSKIIGVFLFIVSLL